jgi:uncharacterized membrane protein
MVASLYPVLLLGATVGAGLNAGLFFIFSVCIMGALARLPAEQGIAAMQSINIVILNPLFLGVFLGTAVLGVAAIVGGVMTGGSAGLLAIAGGVLFIGGTIVVTIVFNVPMNDALEALSPQSTGAANFWNSRYLTDWVRWNHVRTLSSTGALVFFALALRAA